MNAGTVCLTQRTGRAEAGASGRHERHHSRGNVGQSSSLTLRAQQRCGLVHAGAGKQLATDP